jgi:hypothetical protein
MQNYGMEQSSWTVINNDIEDGINRSRYARLGNTCEYWCNQVELEMTLRQILNIIETGQDAVRH